MCQNYSSAVYAIIPQQSTDNAIIIAIKQFTYASMYNTREEKVDFYEAKEAERKTECLYPSSQVSSQAAEWLSIMMVSIGKHAL